MFIRNFQYAYHLSKAEKALKDGDFARFEKHRKKVKNIVAKAIKKESKFI